MEFLSITGQPALLFLAKDYRAQVEAVMAEVGMDGARSERYLKPVTTGQKDPLRSNNNLSGQQVS
jgi:hypothetical protein